MTYGDEQREQHELELDQLEGKRIHEAIAHTDRENANLHRTVERLERENKDLVAKLKNLVDWYDYDPNCIDNCPACIAYADAKEILDQIGETKKAAR